jgi:flagellum-specific peptidoglycan hydrolase FlgJ
LFYICLSLNEKDIFKNRKEKKDKMIVNKNLPVVVKKALDDGLQRFKAYAKQIWLRVAFFSLIILVLTQKEFSFQFTIGNTGEQTASILDATIPLEERKEANSPVPIPKTVSASTLPTDKKWWETIKEESKDIRSNMNLANSATAVSEALTPEQQKAAAQYSNLGFVLSPNYAKKHKVDPAIVAAKNKTCTDYIAKYSITAKEEADLYNIPASITLAQGLLESNAGKSSLSSKENNHFGIKCRKKCIGCRCANYTDDSRYDMFRIFDSAWESFREHSKLLSSKRYKHLSKLKLTDYKNWAHGLKAAGYATDKRYASKLIMLIEKLELDRFDR